MKVERVDIPPEIRQKITEAFERGRRENRKPCNWLQQLWHRHLRQLDMELLWRAFIALRGVEEAKKLWEEFKKQPDQKHWRCCCSDGVEPTTLWSRSKRH